MPDGIRRLLLPIMLVFVGGVIGLVLAAVDTWRFEPPTLSTAVDTAAGRVEAGTAVPVIVSIAVPVSHAAREGFES
jgi:hypothetical protein